MRSIAALSALSAFAALSALSVLGCEDGPTQPYSAPPDGASNYWNNGNTAPVTDPAKQGFTTTGSSGTNKQDICTGAQKAARWALMVQAPLTPPRGGAGVDLAGDQTWKGLTIEEAEKINCQSENEGDQFGDGSQVNQWGDNGEVWFVYRVSTRKGFSMSFFPGYEGTIEAANEDGSDTWSIPVNSQIRRNGQNFALDWTGNNGQNFIEPADAYFRAMMHTYAPSLPIDPPGVTCFDTGRCVKGSFGDVAYFWIPAVGSAIWIENQNAPQPTPSIPNRIDQDLAKILAFSFSAPLLKLDAEGPIAHGGLLGPAAAGECTLRMGQSYGDFLRDCVQATGDANVDSEELNKLLGGLRHSTERFSFDVVGIDVNFSDKNLADDNIVRDHDLPDPTDIATEFSIDQQTQGKIVNDRDADGNVDLHGAGAVYKEYARLTREELLRLSGIKDGDTSKCLFPVKPPADFDPQAFLASLPDYCTGFEGFLTAAPPTSKKDFVNLGTDVATINPGMGRGLKLGHQQVTFCFDANGDLNTGYYSCSAGDTFPTSFAQVQQVFGKGRTANLPTEAQDVRFFFKQWFKAFVKYMQVADQNPVPDLSAIRSTRTTCSSTRWAPGSSRSPSTSIAASPARPRTRLIWCSRRTCATASSAATTSPARPTAARRPSTARCWRTRATASARRTPPSSPTSSAARSWRLAGCPRAWARAPTTARPTTTRTTATTSVRRSAPTGRSCSTTTATRSSSPTRGPSATRTRPSASTRPT
jgi:hypothetical protein